MKGFFLVLMLIALLVVGVLVMKNVGEQQSDTGKMEATEKAKKTADDVQKKFDALKKKADKAYETNETNEAETSDE